MSANSPARIEDTSDRTAFTVAAQGAAAAFASRRGLTAFGLLVTTLLCANGIWALSSGEANLISGTLAALMPLKAAVAVLVGVVLCTLAGMAMAGQRAGTRLALTCLAYLIGVVGYRWLQTGVIWPEVTFPFETKGDALGALLYRAVFILPAIPLLGVYLLGNREERLLYPLRFGDLSKRSFALFRKGGAWSWWKILGALTVLAILPLAVFMQFQVDFEPITSGKWFLFLPSLLVLALFNALAEDLIIIGLIMPAIHRYCGTVASVVLIALFFGFLHLGSAPGIIAALPSVLAITCFILIAAKSVNEVRGLGFSVLVHMGVDIAVHSAHFI